MSTAHPRISDSIPREVMVRRMKWHHTRTIDGMGGYHDYVDPPEYVDAASAADVELAYGFDEATGDEAARILDAWRARYTRHDGNRPWNFGSWAWHIHLSAYPPDEAASAQAVRDGTIATGRLRYESYCLHAPALYLPIASATDLDVAMAWRRCPDQRAELEADWRRRHARDEDLCSWAQPIHEAAYARE